MGSGEAGACGRGPLRPATGAHHAHCRATEHMAHLRYCQAGSQRRDTQPRSTPQACARPHHSHTTARQVDRTTPLLDTELVSVPNNHAGVLSRLSQRLMQCPDSPTSGWSSPAVASRDHKGDLLKLKCVGIVTILRLPVHVVCSHKTFLSSCCLPMQALIKDGLQKRDDLLRRAGMCSTMQQQASSGSVRAS